MANRSTGCRAALHPFATEVKLITLINYKVSFVCKVSLCSAGPGLGLAICLTTSFAKLVHSIAIDIMKMNVFCDLDGRFDNN